MIWLYKCLSFPILNSCVPKFIDILHFFSDDDNQATEVSDTLLLSARQAMCNVIDLKCDRGQTCAQDLDTAHTGLPLFSAFLQA